MLKRLLSSTAALALAMHPAAALTLQQLTPQNQAPAPNPDGYRQDQLDRLPPDALGLGTTVGGALVMPRVLNNAQVAKLLPGLGHFRREGFSVSGDGGSADYMTTSSPCSLNSGAGDGGAQIGLTGPIGSSYIGCANIDPRIRWSPRIWGATDNQNADASAPWAKALAYLGSLGGAQTLFDDIQNSAISNNVQTVIPSNVQIDCGGSFEGGDGAYSTSMPTINFNQGNGGFLMQDQSSIRGCHVLGSSTSMDHVIEYAGKIGLKSVRVSAPGPNGVLVTHNLTVGAYGAGFDGVAGTATNQNGQPFVNSGSGLTAGTYTKVAFTEAAGSGATATIVVGSGGTITSATLDGSGIGYVPYACANLLAGALYSGSPAISCFGYTVTTNTGRTRIEGLYIDGATSGIGLEIDDTYDFPTVNDVHCWHPNGTTTAGSKCIRIGKADGAIVSRAKAWAVDYAVYGDGPPNMYPQYTSVVNSVFDNVNNGTYFSSAQKNLVISGNICRATGGTCETINGPNIYASIAGNDDLCLSKACTYLDYFQQATVTGNNYHRGDGATSTAFVSVSPDAAVATPANYYIGSNAFDLKSPGIYLGQYAPGGTVGPNGWPNGSAYAYVVHASENMAINHVLPTTAGRVTITPDSNGNATIPHGLGVAPTNPTAALVGAPAASNNRVVIISLDATNITVRVLNGSGAPVTSGNYDVTWQG